MYTAKAFFTNYVLMSTVCAWFVAQFLKMVTTLFKEKKFKPSLMLFSSGGMPSSHSATVGALCTSSAIKCGFGSFEFAISAILAMVVITDAMGVRWETGEQSKVINKIVKKLFAGTPEDAETALKELVGHTPLQVLMGVVVGVTIPFIMMLIIK
jgi:acid phosphatase family membrane protein YuiD